MVMPTRQNNACQAGAVHYRQQLGLFSGTMLVVGGIIGAGIFLSPSVVAQRVGSAPLTLGAWALGAVIAIIGGLVYGELGSRRPEAGGTYVYLREAYGTLPAFLYGWALFLIIGSGAIAAVALTGANYIAELSHAAPETATPIAVVLIAGLTLINILGVQLGAVTGNVLTVLKLAAIAMLVVAAIALSPAHEPPPAVANPSALQAPGSVSGVIGAMGAALVPVLFSFGGWQQTNAVAEELVDARRTLPRALILGVLIVAAAYLMVNIAYLRALGPEGLAASSAPAADAMQIYLGPVGRVLITAGIVASTVGFLAMVILMSARVYQAMAADGLFFMRVARLHPRWRTPVWALAGQGVVSLLLLLSGTYGQLLDYVVFADWIFFGSTAASLLVLRSRDRRTGRATTTATADAAAAASTVSVPGHPYTTLVFVAAAAYVVVGSILSNPTNALRGVLVLVAGLPVYAYWNRQRHVN